METNHQLHSGLFGLQKQPRTCFQIISSVSLAVGTFHDRTIKDSESFFDDIFTKVLTKQTNKTNW